MSVPFELNQHLRDSVTQLVPLGAQQVHLGPCVVELLAKSRQLSLQIAQPCVHPSAGGQRIFFNYYTLDGVNNTDPNFQNYIALPSIDAIQEFKVQTGVYPAEFGHQSTQVNVVTKSGGNQYHGSIFELPPCRLNGGYGELDRRSLAPPRLAVRHRAAVDIDFGKNWEFNFGVGVGVTGSTDHLLVKAIVGYRFTTKNN